MDFGWPIEADHKTEVVLLDVMDDHIVNQGAICGHGIADGLAMLSGQTVAIIHQESKHRLVS